MTGRESLCSLRGHHLWDTENDTFATYTPDPALDDPMVIHECLDAGCRALRIERRVFNEGRVTLVYEVTQELGGGPCPACGGPHDSPCLALPAEHRAVTS